MENCRQAALDILRGCRPRGYTDAHGGPALPDCATAPTSAFFLNSSDHLAGAVGIPERYQDLVEHDVIQHRVTRSNEAVGKPCRVAAGALDQIGQAFAAKLTLRGPDFDTPRAAGKVGRILIRNAVFVLRKIGGADRHRRT
jgi:hypothetical protein